VKNARAKAQAVVDADVKKKADDKQTAYFDKLVDNQIKASRLRRSY
jgi:hypothetical protein